jgi:hypothetical protein
MAQSDSVTAYNALAGQACNFNLTGEDLGGLMLTTGVYCFSSSAQLTGALTLDAQGNPGAVFIFQIGSTLTTASNSSVNIINSGSACNVFWQVGSSATLGTTTSFMGGILAKTSITLNTGASLSGGALAQTGATTLDSNTVSVAQCNASFVAPPTIVKAFGAAAIGVGGATTLSFTINNPNATIALNGVAFTDTLPANLIVSTPNGLTGSCGGGTITAVASSGSVSLTGATLAGGARCTFSVNVTGTNVGAANNSVTVTSTNGGTGNTSLTSLAVVSTPPQTAPPTIVKVFGAAAIGVGGATTLSFTINNPNPSTALNGVAFADTLPAGLIVSIPNGLTGSCGGGTIIAVAGSGSVSLTGATLAGGASCTFSVNVTGTNVGAQNNSVIVTSTNGGTGNTSAALLNVVVAVVAPPTISKLFGTTGSILPGGTTTLSFTIENPNATVALNGIAFIDTLPAGLVVATPNGLNGSSCGGGIITATPGSGSISLTGAMLAAGASCTFSVNVTATISNVPGSFLVGYAANLQAGESMINITNTGASGASLPGPGFGAAVGNICVNVFAFDPNEELISCCSCLVTPDQTVNLGVNRDLTARTITGVVPTSVTVKLLATLAGGGLLTNITGNVTSSNGGIGNTASAQILSGVASAGCTNSAATVTSAALANGVAAWHTTLHATPTPGSYATTEAPFTGGTLSAAELASIGGRCAAIVGNGSGFGICTSCQSGALGGAKL